MDLERLGARGAARLLVESYRQAGGDPGSDTLLVFHGVHRALVRAKVALPRAAQLGDERSAAVTHEAGTPLDLAERLAWRARGRLVPTMNGPPASGKSTLADALSRRSGWPVLSSDALRQHRHGLAQAATAPNGDYVLDARAEIYQELGGLARAALADGQGTIVDATFGHPRLRAAFLDGLGDQQRLIALECQVPKELRERRARERTPADARGSDAGPAIAASLAASFSGWNELPEDAILTLHSSVDADMLVDQIADWLDTCASVVSRRTARHGTEVGGAPRT